MSANATATGTITLTLGTIWQTAFGGRDGRVEHVTTRGATMVFQDGLHHCHGPNWTYAHNDVESGDDALAVGLGSGDVYLAAEVANGTYDAMKNIVFLDNHVTSWRGHAFRAYQIAGDTNPAYRITDIEVLATTGRAGILRNGGYYIESLMGSDGVQMIQRVNIEGAPLEVGSAAHDDVNGFGALVSGASDVTIDPVAIRVTEKSNAVASVVTTAGSTAITAPAGSFSPSDVGRSIWGTNIPIATTLAAVASDTAATLSGNASASGTATATVGAVVGFDLVKVYSSPDCKIGGLKPGALQIKRFALDVNASDRFKLDDYKLTHGPFVPQSPVRLRDSPDFDLGRGELLELRNGATGITLAAGTANTNSGSIHDARVKHVAGASLGYAVNPTTTGLTKLSLRDNDFSGAAQGGVGPALPTAIPSFKATGNRGVVDYPAATPRVATAVNYTALASDGVVAVTSTATPRTITLPAASAMSPGAPLTVKDESGAAVTNNITISRAGTDTIEGAITKVISTNYGTVTLYSTGSVWMVA